MLAFKDKIRRLREGKNLTTRMLAEVMDISPGMVSKYENGIHEPTLSILRKYASIFQVTLDYLCDDEQE